MAIVEAEQFRPEADRERLDRNAAPARDQEWPSSWKTTTTVRTTRKAGIANASDPPSDESNSIWNPWT